MNYWHKIQLWGQGQLAHWREEIRLHHRAMLKSGLGYGLGLVSGIILSNLLFRSVNAELFTTGNQVVRLVIGLLLAFAIYAVGAALSGATGGWMLPLAPRARGRTATVIFSALGMGVLFSMLLFPVVLVIGLMSFYDVSELRPRLFGVVLGLAGLLFGALEGLWMGFSTVGSGRVGRVARPAAWGFGLGGLFFGWGIWAYLVSYTDPDLRQIAWGWLALGVFAFGALGGASLGLAYSRLSLGSIERPLLHGSLKQATRRYWVITVILILAVYYLRPLIAAVGDMITPKTANLASILTTETLGTRWSDPQAVSTAGRAKPEQPAVGADPRGGTAIAWVQTGAAGEPGEISLAYARPGENGAAPAWQPPINVSGSPQQDSTAPQAAVAPDGRVYLAWEQATGPGQSAIAVSSCRDGSCTTPQLLRAAQDDLECGWPANAGRQVNSAARLAINGQQLMLTWQSGERLLYSDWSSGEAQPVLQASCLPQLAPATGPAALAAGPGGGFALAYASSGPQRPVYLLKYNGQEWVEAAHFEPGGDPALAVDGSGKSHLAWCGPGRQPVYQPEQGPAETVSTLTCLGTPAILFDSQNNPHLLWASDQVVNVSGKTTSGAVIYETKLADGDWQTAALAAVGPDPAAGPLQFSALSDPAGVLHLGWTGAGEDGQSLAYAQQVQYACPSAPADPLVKTVYQAGLPYRSPDDPTPYCGNQYDRLIFAPNPAPAFSNEQPSSNGAFDKLAETVREARYEVLYSTMWYGADENLDSPGAVMAAAVADLYRQVKTNPERYPRGMTVRILLGNPPEVVTDRTGDQLWSLLEDLRNAGVMEMENAEIGWKVEAANFEGALPHAHTKMLVVDGKTATAAGFNFEYYHYPVEHPSGLGEGRWDMGLQISGPVAQDAVSAFDDLWVGSDGRRCNFHPLLDLAWQTTCRNYKVEGGHAPEVLKYYLPGGSAAAFSLYRTEAQASSDDQVVAAIAAAQQSVDATHVNFTLQLICDLDILYEVCNFDQALPYYAALLQAAENGAQVRVLVEKGSIEGIETTLGLEVLLKEATRRGVKERFEVRFFDGWMHLKTALVDDAFLVVGSQNFHYSAFGKNTGLAEYNLGTDDPQAIADYQQFFEYQWARAEAWEK